MSGSPLIALKENAIVPLPQYPKVNAVVPVHITQFMEIRLKVPKFSQKLLYNKTYRAHNVGKGNSRQQQVKKSFNRKDEIRETSRRINHIRRFMRVIVLYLKFYLTNFISNW